MWSVYRVPKTGHMIKQSSIDHMMMQNATGLHCHARVDCTSLTMLATKHQRDGFDIVNPQTGQRTWPQNGGFRHPMAWPDYPDRKKP